MKKILVSWSSGKDSAWALHQLRQSGEYEIAGLLTTVNTAFGRVAMHGTRSEVLEVNRLKLCRPATMDRASALALLQCRI